MEIKNGHFRDARERIINLRGVNLSGSVKQPFTPFLPSHIRQQFFESEKTVSFVNRPFPLEEADEHLARLKLWGFNFIRFNVTWEALEHAGPGEYDYEFMDYLVKVLFKLQEYGFTCFIDPHQDVWSRFSGGSGAPGWTLRLVGLEPRNFAATDAAIVHSTYHDPENFPKMIWPTNYTKLACGTMFTLFFGGATFAPKCTIDGVNVQEYLQDHFMNAFCALIQRIGQNGLLDTVVVGYDSLNEPHHGFIGIKDIRVFPPEVELRHGNTPSILQTMLLGAGHACKVEYWDFTWLGPKKTRHVLVDPKGVSAWQQVPDAPKYSFSGNAANNEGCIWAHHGLYDPVTKECLKPDYFRKHPTTGQPVEFKEEFWKPYVERFAAKIRAVHPKAIMFVDPPVNEKPPKMDIPNICYTPHWYDGLTLMNKRFQYWFNIDLINLKRGKYWSIPMALRFGEKGIRQCFRDQLKTIKSEGREYLNNAPCLIGEIGIPYDMNEKESYSSGDYTNQIKAMDCNMHALEANLLSFTLWNYCSDNTNTYGDAWNGEDLSIFSRVKKRMSMLLEPVFSSSKASLEPGHSKLSLEKKKSVNSARVSALDFGQSSIQIDGSNSPRKSATNKSVSMEYPRTSRAKRDSGKGSFDLDRLKKLPSNLNLGGRALEAIIRPYPIFTAGEPVSFSFNMKTCEMVFVFEQTMDDVTEIFVPHFQYPIEHEIVYACDSGDIQVDYPNQRMKFKGEIGLRTVSIRKAKRGHKGGVVNLTPRELKSIHGKRECVCQIL